MRILMRDISLGYASIALIYFNLEIALSLYLLEIGYLGYGHAGAWVYGYMGIWVYGFCVHRLSLFTTYIYLITFFKCGMSLNYLALV